MVIVCTLRRFSGWSTRRSTERLCGSRKSWWIPISAVKEQLRGISCDRAVGLGPNKVLSAPDAIGQALERYLEEKEGVQEPLPLGAPVRSGAEQAQIQSSGVASTATNFFGSCPDCGAGQLSYEEGCVKCHVCGYSKCG